MDPYAKEFTRQAKTFKVLARIQEAYAETEKDRGMSPLPWASRRCANCWPRPRRRRWKRSVKPMSDLLRKTPQGGKHKHTSTQDYGGWSPFGRVSFPLHDLYVHRPEGGGGPV